MSSRSSPIMDDDAHHLQRQPTSSNSESGIIVGSVIHEDDHHNSSDAQHAVADPVVESTASPSPSPSASVSPASHRGAAITANAAATAASAAVHETRYAELHALLVEKAAEAKHNEDLVRALQRHVETLEAGLHERAEFSDRLRAELEEKAGTIARERIARKAAEGQLDELRRAQVELAAVHEALVCFRIPTARGGGGGTPRGGSNSMKRIAGALQPGDTASDVAALGRAFMALQLDVLRTFTWAGALLHEQYVAGAQAIAAEQEAAERRRILCEFEAAARRIAVVSAERDAREWLDRRVRAEQLVAAAGEKLLFGHERLYCRLLLELSARHSAEWTALAALYHESLRKAAAAKLRQSNALLGRARDDVEEKNKLLEESRRTMNLLKARYEATSKERAAAAAAATSNHRKQQQQQAAAAASATSQEEHASQEQHLLLNHRYEVPTAASSSKTRKQQTFTVVDSPAPPAVPTANSSAAGLDSSIVGTPPPALLPASAAAPLPHPAQRPATHSRASSFAADGQPAAAGAPASDSSMSAAAAAATSAVAAAAAAQAARQAHEARVQLEALRDKVQRMEALLERQDEQIMRLKTERNVLELEADSLASQCRLLDQACRFGAKQAAVMMTQAVIPRRGL